MSKLAHAKPPAAENMLMKFDITSLLKFIVTFDLLFFYSLLL